MIASTAICKTADIRSSLPRRRRQAEFGLSILHAKKTINSGFVKAVLPVRSLFACADIAQVDWHNSPVCRGNTTWHQSSGKGREQYELDWRSAGEENHY